MALWGEALAVASLGGANMTRSWLLLRSEGQGALDSLTLWDTQVGIGAAQEKEEGGGLGCRRTGGATTSIPWALGSPPHRWGGKGQAGGGAGGRAPCRARVVLLPPQGEPLLHPGGDGGGAAEAALGAAGAAGAVRGLPGDGRRRAAGAGAAGRGAGGPAPPPGVLEAAGQPLLPAGARPAAAHGGERSPGCGAGAASRPGRQSGLGAAPTAPPATE